LERFGGEKRASRFEWLALVVALPLALAVGDNVMRQRIDGLNGHIVLARGLESLGLSLGIDLESAMECRGMLRRRSLVIGLVACSREALSAGLAEGKKMSRIVEVEAEVSVAGMFDALMSMIHLEHTAVAILLEVVVDAVVGGNVCSHCCYADS